MIRAIEVNLAGKTAIVTGANTGIGKEIARDLARLNARVIMACRSEDRGRAALEEIVADTGNHKTELRLVDVSSQKSVLTFAQDFAEREGALHILVNNAGAWFEEKRASVDGIDLTWATNVLGPFLLTRELLPVLERTGEPGASARVVNVASEMARGLDMTDAQFTRRSYDGMAAYAQSKQADRMVTWALARRLAGKPVTANALHPGWVNTEIIARERCMKLAVACAGARLFAKKPPEGADTATWLAAAPELEGVTSRFFVDRAERECRFRDPASEEALWALCEAMIAGKGATPAGQSISSTTLPKSSLPAM